MMSVLVRIWGGWTWRTDTMEFWQKGSLLLCVCVCVRVRFHYLKNWWKRRIYILHEVYAWTQGGSRRGGAVFKCPSAWRLSHSLSAPGSMQTDFRPSCRSSLSFASNSYLVFFAPVFVRISGAHLLFPFSDTSRVNLRRSLFFVGLFAQTCSYSVHFVVSALTCGVERLVSADIIPLHYFCQARLLLRNLSPYLQ